MRRIQHIGDTAAHPGSEVFAGSAENDGAPAGHIFAAVVAAALGNSDSARVAHAEAFAGDAVDIGFAARRTVERHIADDDIIFGGKGGCRIGTDNQFAARKSLAEIVIGIADKLHGHALRNEGAEGLPTAAVTADDIGVILVMTDPMIVPAVLL